MSEQKLNMTSRGAPRQNKNEGLSKIRKIIEESSGAFKNDIENLKDLISSRKNNVEAELQKAAEAPVVPAEAPVVPAEAPVVPAEAPVVPAKTQKELSFFN